MESAIMNAKEFVHTMNSLKSQVVDIRSTIKSAMIEALGELPAIAAVSYTGDLQDGDIDSFARRTEELFGTGSPRILAVIVVCATKNFQN